MGFKRTRVDELGALIEEKDARIERLELEVQAFAARASHIQSRFLATLDTLDELQEKHRLELSEMTEEITALRAKLSRYVSRVKEAEAERDDMREAVVELVEKGGFRGGRWVAGRHIMSDDLRISLPLCVDCS